MCFRMDRPTATAARSLPANHRQYTTSVVKVSMILCHLGQISSPSTPEQVHVNLTYSLDRPVKPPDPSIHRNGLSHQLSLWRLPAPDPNRDPIHEHAMAGERSYGLISLGRPEAEFNGFETATAAILWGPTEEEGVVTLADGILKRWRLGDGR